MKFDSSKGSLIYLFPKSLISKQFNLFPSIKVNPFLQDKQ